MNEEKPGSDRIDMPGKSKQKRFGWSRWLLGGAVLWGLAYMLYGWLMNPKINDHPTQKVVIHGQFPFDKGLALGFKVDFRSRNPTCKQMARVFLIIPATEVNRSTYSHVPVRRVGQNQYETEVYLDYILPGFCEWEYAGMSYNISEEGLPSDAYSGLGGIPRLIKDASFSCKRIKVLKREISTFHCRESRGPSVMDDVLRPAEFNFVWEGE